MNDGKCVFFTSFSTARNRRVFQKNVFSFLLTVDYYRNAIGMLRRGRPTGQIRNTTSECGQNESCTFGRGRVRSCRVAGPLNISLRGVYERVRKKNSNERTMLFTFCAFGMITWKNLYFFSSVQMIRKNGLFIITCRTNFKINIKTREKINKNKYESPLSLYKAVGPAIINIWIPSFPNVKN